MAGKDRSHLSDFIIHNDIEASMSILESSSSFWVQPSQTLIITSKNNLASKLLQHQGRYVIYSFDQLEVFNDWWNPMSYSQHVASNYA